MSFPSPLFVGHTLPMFQTWDYDMKIGRILMEPGPNSTGIQLGIHRVHGSRQCFEAAGLLQDPRAGVGASGVGAGNRPETGRCLEQRGYPLVNFYIAMEHHRFQWVNPLFLWPCSIAMGYVKLPEGVAECRKSNANDKDHFNMRL